MKALIRAGHLLSGNGAGDSPPVVGGARGTFAAGVVGAMNALIWVLTDSPDTEVLMGILNPTAVLLAFMLYGIWDKLLGKTNP